MGGLNPSPASAWTALTRATENSATSMSHGAMRYSASPSGPGAAIGPSHEGMSTTWPNW